MPPNLAKCPLGCKIALEQSQVAINQRAEGRGEPWYLDQVLGPHAPLAESGQSSVSDTVT